MEEEPLLSKVIILAPQLGLNDPLDFLVVAVVVVVAANSFRI